MTDTKHIPTLTAQVTPYSSVVGSGVSLLKSDGSNYAQIMIIGISTSVADSDVKSVQLEISDLIVKAVNSHDKMVEALELYDKWDNTPNDIGGSYGYKGAALAKFIEAKNETLALTKS